MFCSNCGKPLGAVAHIYKDELLCEDCFLKAGGGGNDENQPNPAPSTTVLIAKHNDQERAEAASSGNFAPQEVANPSTSIPNTVQDSANPAARLFYPNERILWRRTFSKGIIHRSPTFTEVITNARALVLDDSMGSIVRACPLRNAAVVVMNARRDSSRTSTGYGYYGHYAGASLGSSRTIGDVEFLMNGNIVLTFHNVGDPHGLKSLVQGALRSAG